ncbi:MAG: exosome complex component RRP4 [Amphiamblys sp. WSBS2006]|nr:MAG: exosome complex component RRP4 [Amphiamblys sp. WSBS2006]
MDVLVKYFVRHKQGLAGTYSALPGDFLSDNPQTIQGHGTYRKNGAVYASLAGKVLQTNMVLQVVPYSQRYIPQIGDVVVGRVFEIQKKRWKIDLNSLHEAVLKLAAVDLPGSIQRKKLEADEIEMRRLISAGDVVIGEVQEKHGDGTCAIHTRNARYGRRGHGVLLKTSPDHIQIRSTHFIQIEPALEAVVGINGYIWVETGTDPTEEQFRVIAQIRRYIKELDA